MINKALLWDREKRLEHKIYQNKTLQEKEEENNRKNKELSAGVDSDLCISINDLMNTLLCSRISFQGFQNCISPKCHCVNHESNHEFLLSSHLPPV